MSDQSKLANGSLIVAGILTILVVLVVIGLVVIMLVPPKKLTNVDVIDWLGGQIQDQKCKSDDECYKKCNGLMGCCARCTNGQCTTGALTAQGCMISSGTGKQDQQDQNSMMGNNNSSDSNSSSGFTNNVRPRCINQSAQSAQNARNTTGRTLDTAHGLYEMNMPAGLTFPPGTGAPQCTNNQEAFLSKCTGDKAYPGCCGVCSSGMAWQGQLGPDGSCQTSVQQSGYPGMGLAPPNTYVVSSSGPKFGISMGSCSVKPINTGLQHYLGYFDSCSTNMAPVDYSRPGSYGPSYSSCG